MPIRTVIKQNTYFDSVSLMSISTRANNLPDVEYVFIAMATEMNKGMLRSLNMLSDELAAAKSGDLFIVVSGDSDSANDAALEAIDALCRPEKTAVAQNVAYATLASACADLPDSNLAIISVNGLFAAREARLALENNLNVMLFSDNVSLADERALKQLAQDRGLLMMGPDCGTAMINGTALCFGNRVRRGTIGIIGASGTGSQEISVRIHKFGGGISQLIGTGGRDLSADIGGMMTLAGLNMLAADPETAVIVLVSKPPSPAVAQRILARAKNCGKPVVACFLGYRDPQNDGPDLQFASSTKQAALKAILLTGVAEESLDLHPLNWPLIEDVRAMLSPRQRYIRGLFCGGTLCDEALFAAMEKYPEVYSNIHPDPYYRLGPLSPSIGHAFLDFGDDAFTDGKPHPMIDPTQRIHRLLQEARDPEVAVIMLDFILGFGGHDDPVGALLGAIQDAQRIAREQGRTLVILGYVLGTDLDTPSLQQQCQLLTDNGVIWASSSTNAGLLAREFVANQEGKS